MKLHLASLASLMIFDILPEIEENATGDIDIYELFTILSIMENKKARVILGRNRIDIVMNKLDKSFIEKIQEYNLSTKIRVRIKE